jgi:hypothetical protein
MEVSEREGVPAVGIFGREFRRMAEVLAERSGLPYSRLAVYPGMLATEPEARLVQVAREELTGDVVRGLTDPLPPREPSTESTETESTEGERRSGIEAPAATTIVFRGGLDEVEEHFDEQGWSDGLPVTPPTVDRVAAFLGHAGGRAPGEVLGVLAPECGEATVASVAVNGVMAGCRPEHMPILLAAVECLADPASWTPAAHPAGSRSSS